MKITRRKGSGAAVLDVPLDKLLSGKVGKVGWFAGSRYPDGTSVAYVATIQEYGYATDKQIIPPRPFMRPTIMEKRNEWRGIMRRGVKAVLRGDETIERVMEKIGLAAAGDVREKIRSIWTPPLAQATIQARLQKMANGVTIGNLDKPLVETGRMLASVTNVVEDE